MVPRVGVAALMAVVSDNNQSISVRRRSPRCCRPQALSARPGAVAKRPRMKLVFVCDPAAGIVLLDELPRSTVCINLLPDASCLLSAAFVLGPDTKGLFFLETGLQSSDFLLGNVFGHDARCDLCGGGLDAESLFANGSGGYNWNWNVGGYIADFLDFRLCFGKEEVNLGGAGGGGVTTTGGNMASLAGRHRVALLVEPRIEMGEAHRHRERDSLVVLVLGFVV